jgi:alpha-glucosidase (family GH31 glycosyl hydrolase)
MNTGLVKRIFHHSLYVLAGALVALGYGAQVGDYVSHTTNGNMIVINTGGTQKVRITVCTPTIVRVEFDPRGTLTDNFDLLDADFMTKSWTPAQQPVVTDKGASMEIATGKLTVQVQKSPLRIKWIETATGTTLTGEDNTRGMAVGSGENPWLQLTQRSEEHYFGWGEAYGWLKKGLAICDKKGYAVPTNEVRGNEAPFMYSTSGYGIFVLFGAKETGGTTLSVSDKSPSYDLRGGYAKYQPAIDYVPNMLCYYFITGPSGSASVNNWREIIDGYTQITGKPQILGKKWYGIHRDVCKIDLTVSDMQAICDGWRNGRFPMDVVRQDVDFDWGKLGYLPTVPNQSGWNAQVPSLVTYFKNKGFTFGGMVNGYGYGGCCPGWAGVLMEDSARAKTAVDHGFDYAWYDAMAYQKRSKAQKQWNVWNYAHGGDEAKTFVTKGWWSMCSQSWAASMTGDGLNNPNYAVLPAHLEQSLVGYAWSNTDIGENGEWNYIGTSLRPMICHHQSGSGGGATGQGCDGYFRIYDNSKISSTMQDVIRKWARFHYRFIPYLFTYGMISHETGMPIWRHMVCHNPADAATYNKVRQAYVGEEIIISPYYPDGDNRSGSRSGIYLPQGTWYDYFDGTKTTGPTTVNYSCDPGTGMINDKLPMFVKAGSIITLMDTLQYIGERADSLMTVQVWPTNGTATAQSGAFTLYEDEGVWNVAMQTRAPASKTLISYSFNEDGANQQTRVAIGAFAGSMYCPQNKRIWRVELHNIKQVNQVMSGGTLWTTPIAKAAYDAGTAGFYWDAAGGGVCYINAAGNAASGIDILAATGAVSIGSAAGLVVDLSRNVSVVKHGRSILVSVPLGGGHLVEVFSAQGKLLESLAATGAKKHVISVGCRSSMIYLVKVSAMGRSVVKKLFL